MLCDTDSPPPSPSPFPLPRVVSVHMLAAEDNAAKVTKVLIGTRGGEVLEVDMTREDAVPRRLLNVRKGVLVYCTLYDVQCTCSVYHWY